MPHRSEKLFDMAGQVAFSSMVTVSGWLHSSGDSPRALVAQLLVYCWSLRLGWFLFRRFLQRGSDFRFVQARHKLGYFFFTWTAQGLWCLPVGLPVLLVQANQEKVGPCGSDLVGIVLWASGLLLETVADRQKLRFVNEREAAGMERRWIDIGVWKYSRHPNYCGGCVVWLGMAVLCSPGQNLGLMAVSPVFSAVFLMESSLPWLEAVADSRFRQDPEYWRYKSCLLYTSDAADEEDSVDLGGRRIIKKKKRKNVRYEH
eukprot:TRINITY_DN28359_c0_g1_i2.p1 TRINITY_DN28359_c0_g1~~TRINITY_DN28359_c0_g1_i2.p1  ORF type:complete len:259 (+),score=39.35 TRINITY_DN28359_c0_g1_i2:310-1086(+)